MTRPTALACPRWCARIHGEVQGEDDTVHVSEHAAAANMLLRLCATIDPATGDEDGPYLLIDAKELTLGEAEDLIDALTTIIAEARDTGAAPPD